MSIRTIIGDYSYGNIRGVGKKGTITIGKFCSIGTGVQAVLVDHRIDYITTYPFQAKVGEWSSSKLKGHPLFKDIIVENDVWIGNNVTILGGSRIDSGCVIGANSVVAGYVEPYSIVVGNPGTIIRKRFDLESIQKLLEIKWWDWDKKKIDENLYLLCSTDIRTFISKYGGVKL